MDIIETATSRYRVTQGIPLATLVGVVVLAAIILLLIRWNKSR